MKKTLLFLLTVNATLCINAQIASDKIEIKVDDDSIIFVVDGKESAIANVDMAAYYLNMGLEAANTADYSGAEDKFRVALLYDLGNSEILYNLGLAQYFQEEFENAIISFNAASDIDIENKNIYNQRGLCQARLGNFKAAESDFKIMLKYDPNFPMGNYNYGILMLQMGNYDAACEYLNKSDSYGYENAPAAIANYCAGME